MKKLIILIVIFFLTPFFALATEVKNLDLKKDSLYLLILDDEAVDFKVSNPNVINFQLVNTLIDDKQELIIKPLSLGHTSFEVQTKTSLYKFEFNILEKASPVCENLLEIEKPSEATK